MIRFTPFGSVLLLVLLNGGWVVSSGNAPPSGEGLVLWLDATDVDGDGNPDNNPGEGTPLAQWSDKSGLENHILQPIEEHQPRWHTTGFQGGPALHFDGNDTLSRDKFHGFVYRDQPIHMIAVLQSQAEAAQEAPRLLEFQPVDGDLQTPASVKQHGFWIGPQGDGRCRIGTHYGDESRSLTPAFDATPHVVEIVYGGAQNWIHYLDGARDGAGLFGDRDFHGFTKDLRFAVAQHYGWTDANSYFSGNLAELIIYNRVLTPEEQNLLKKYLSEKYSLPLAIEVVPHFETDIFPVLAEYCHDCHGTDTQESDVDLRTVSAMLRGGKSGPVISRGHPEFSDLLDLVSKGEMPPENENHMPPEKIALLRRWIAAGAPATETIVEPTVDHIISNEDREFWAYQHLVRPDVPQINAEQIKTPIDAFLLEQLQPHNLDFAARAAPRTLIRRLYFDLTGLPPSPEEVEVFLADERENAYELLVDRLLTSQHFGERFARSWLDWSGYVDVHGRDNDFAIIKPLESRWRYRDYVIQSFNSDKPLNRFLLEQLAGDELVDWRTAESFTPEIVEMLTATGFLLCADDDTSQNELNTPDIRHHVLQRTGEVVANNLFALTLQCAKCHNHKYEAIPQLDYYRWLANFSPIFNPQRWVTTTEHAIPDVSKLQQQAIDQKNKDIEQQVQELTQQQEAIRSPHRQMLLEKQYLTIPEPLRSDVKTALKTAADKRTEIQKYLADKLSGHLTITDAMVSAVLSEEEKQSLAAAQQQIGQENSLRRSYGTIQVAVEQSPPSPTYLLRRGEVTKPGVVVQAGIPSIFSSQLTADGPNPAGETSGRRLAVAQQVTAPDTIASALVTRVYVNRLWQEMFGLGIVPTSDNFGVSGSLPTHPELLEWLTTEFIRAGWKTKPLIKLMVMSHAYQQTSNRPAFPTAEQADPENHLLWRARLRRLPSEMVRDRILAVSGALDETMGGAPVPLLARPDGKIVVNMQTLPTPTSHLRRSMYIMNRRNYHLSLLATFDQPLLVTNCTLREPAAIVTQSLTLLNDDFVIQQAQTFATRTLDTAAALPENRIITAFQLALNRPPSDSERELFTGLFNRHAERFRTAGLAAEQIDQKALTEVCHMLLNANEFLYVE